MSPNLQDVSDVDVQARKVLDDIREMKTSKVDKKSTEPFERKLVWPNVVVYVIGHLIGIYAIKTWLFDIPFVQTVFVFSSSYFVSMNGILVGAHRYYAHKSFKASKAMQILMLLSQTASSQNCLWVWVRDHRQHHKYSDTDADPHNSSNGFFFSHVGWLLSKKHPDVIEKGKTVDMSDLDADPLVMFQKRHYFKLWFVTAVLIPVMFPVFVFNEDLMTSFLVYFFGRLIVTLNITWLVNSWAHLYGMKPFDKSIKPVETYFVSFLTGGEGWHNYHHTFPWDYKAAEFGTPLNWVASYIRLCARLGLVWDLKEASDDMVVSRAVRTGDGTPIRTKNSSEVRNGKST